MEKKNNYRIITLITYFIISILAIGMTISYVNTKEDELLNKKYSNISINIQDKIESLINKKKNATLALTITLSNNNDIINILKNKTTKNDNLKQLSLKLRKETDFKNVWFQVINNEGISLFRSWSNKKGDQLSDIRVDLRDMIENPKIRSTISVGRYDMTFKAMVPIFEDEKFVGIIESITHFNSISRGLRLSDNIEPIILVDKSFKKQLSKPFTKLFVKDYYVANISANQDIMKYIEDFGVEKIINIDDFIVSDKYLITSHPIFYNNIKLASFVILKDLELIDKTVIEEYKNNAFLYLGLFIILLGLILYIISYSIYSKEITKLYVQLNKNQKELEDLNNSLKDTIAEEIAENDKKNKLMFHQSKLASMGEMIGNIAHQWRQPLSIITTAASGIKLKKELGILEEKEHNDSLESIITSAQYLSTTIDDFRYFFSPNKEKVEFHIEVLVDKIMKLIENEYIVKNITIVKDIEAMKIHSYENELLQVLLNIFNNAKDEFIKDEISSERFIFLKIFKEKENLLINVWDNAGGIPIGIIDRIFEPYFTTKHKFQGTGIGLYMSEEIISKHMEGSINVKNYDFKYKDVDYTGAFFEIIIPQ